MNEQKDTINVYVIRIDGKLITSETTQYIAEKSFETMCSAATARVGCVTVEDIELPEQAVGSRDTILKKVKIDVNGVCSYAQLEQHTVDINHI